jgi:membrane-bound lytic murein transglycosylase B
MICRGERTFTQTCRCFVLICMLLASPAVSSASDNTADFAALQRRLVADGFSAERVSTLYGSSRTAFETVGVASFFVHSEAKLNYDQFSSANSIRAAAAYMQEHRETLEGAGQRFGVDPAVITAILLVETRLGKLVGNVSVFNVLSSMAALKDVPVRRRFWKKVRGRTALTPEKFIKKATRKADWAYRELKAFLHYTTKERLHPHVILGSYAGAMGICQFIPSNIEPLGVDGNGDGSVNLFDHADAIYSVARYLKNAGWKPGLSAKQASKAVYAYNHSKYYVKAILTIRKKLNQTP